MMRWEYRTVLGSPGTRMDGLLNQLGSVGWELVSVVPAGVEARSSGFAWDVGRMAYVLKRPFQAGG